MNLWVFLTVGTVLGILLSAFGLLSSHKRKIKEMEIEEIKARNANEANKELVEELAKLKDRVAVLEALVTDKGYELDQKISNLK